MRGEGKSSFPFSLASEAGRNEAGRDLRHSQGTSSSSVKKIQKLSAEHGSGRIATLPPLSGSSSLGHKRPRQRERPRDGLIHQRAVISVGGFVASAAIK